MLSNKKQQIITQIEIIDMMKKLNSQCPDVVMEYLVQEKRMSLIQTERLENTNIMGYTTVLSSNLEEQNQFYNTSYNTIKQNHKTECHYLHQFLIGTYFYQDK